MRKPARMHVQTRVAPRIYEALVRFRDATSGTTMSQTVRNILNEWCEAQERKSKEETTHDRD